jgi:UDP-N-acetylglucosamine 2-epimerase
MSRKICIVVGSRANYSSIKSVMSAVQSHPNLTLQLVAGASALLDRYGAVVNLIEADRGTRAYAD